MKIIKTAHIRNQITLAKTRISEREREREDILTAMISRSHHGMLSPPLKKEPTDSKKLAIFASMDMDLFC